MPIDQLKDASAGQGTPFLCLEVNPPRGTDLTAIFQRLDGNLEGIDFLNVTDSALARMKCGALPFASLLKQRYKLEPLVNLACRDRNVIALQSDLLGGWVLGVQSVVALTGDAVTVGDLPESKGVFEVNSIGLLNLISRLNEGKDMAGQDLHGCPAYRPGVVVNPNARNIGAELKRLKKKKEAGACYALSQPVFDEESATTFFRESVGCEIPILAGLLPIKSARSAQNLSSIPGIKLSPRILEQMQSNVDTDLSEFSLGHCRDLAKTLRPYVCGFHVVSGVTPKLALRLAKELVGILKG